MNPAEWQYAYKNPVGVWAGKWVRVWVNESERDYEYEYDCISECKFSSNMSRYKISANSECDHLEELFTKVS